MKYLVKLCFMMIIPCRFFSFSFFLKKKRIQMIGLSLFIFFSFPDIASLLGDRYGHLLNLYESLMLRRLLATDPDTRWCPRPNCTFAVIATGCASCPRIECEKPGCGYSFCYHCKAEWHPNQTCDAARAQRHQKTFRSSSVPFR